MPTEIWCALIAGAVTLITSMGTWHFSIKRDREKQRDDIKAELIKYHEKNREEIQEIRDKDLREIREDVSALGANLQNKIAVIELQLSHTRDDLLALSNRVEKHNGVIDRVYHCEERLGVAEERQRVANHRLDDLEKKAQ